MYGGTPFLPTKVKEPDVQKRPGVYQMIKRFIGMKVLSKCYLSTTSVLAQYYLRFISVLTHYYLSTISVLPKY